jgi:CheY-like chemotaxis protein
MANVLVVDDHADSREVLVLMLEMHGHSARACESGEAAIQSLSGGPPDAKVPEVIVMDDRMSGMSGLELVRWVRQDARFNKLFLIVWSADGSARHKALAGGADDFWTKGSEEMMKSIEQLEGKLRARP